VVGATGVVAAGTVARWPNLRYDTPPSRCGQWVAALEQGQAAARTLMAGEYEAPPAVVLPRYWSDQFGLKIQVCGHMPADAQVSVTRMRPNRRDVARAGFLISYARDGILEGMVAVNAPLAFTAVTRTLMAAPHRRVPVETVTPIATATGRHLTAVA
jgi:NADPH-dependent 2,4-dienoyl-CoA reductase/sulfur reductase-like enzyme